MRCSYSTLVKAKRSGRATSVRVAPTGTAVTEYQVPLGNRHSLKEAGVIGLPSWSDTQIQTETWVRVPRLAATCPRRVVAFDGGRSSETGARFFPHFFEHFAGTAIDAGRWTPVASAGATIAVSGSVATLTTGTTDSVAELIGKINFGTGYAVRTRLKTSHTGAVRQCTAVQFAKSANQYGMFLRPSWIHTWDKKYSNYDGGWTQQAIATWAADTWYTAELRRGAASGTYQIDGQDPVTIAANYYTGADCTPYLQAYYPPGDAAAAAVVTVDLVLVRKCAANEPLAGTAKPTATNRAVSRPMSHADLIRSCCT